MYSIGIELKSAVAKLAGSLGRCVVCLLGAFLLTSVWLADPIGHVSALGDAERAASWIGCPQDYLFMFSIRETEELLVEYELTYYGTIDGVVERVEQCGYFLDGYESRLFVSAHNFEGAAYLRHGDLEYLGLGIYRLTLSASAKWQI